MIKGKTIVVLADHGVGDLLMTVPLLRNIDSFVNNKDKLIIFVKTCREAEVIHLINLKANLEIWESESYARRRYVQLIKACFLLRRLRPDIVLAPMSTDRFRNALFVRLIKAKLSVGPYGNWSQFGFDRYLKTNQRIHKVEQFIQIGILGGFNPKTEPDVTMPISIKLKKSARSKMPGWQKNQQWIALAPGSGTTEIHKRWQIEKFQELVRKLLEYSSNIKIVVYGSFVERELLETMLKGTDIDKNRCHLFVGEDFASSIALLSQCHCMVAACSGALHMAAAAGIPIVGLYGISNPGFTGAYSKQMRVVRLGLECSPCYRLDLLKGCGDPICMSLMTPQLVFSHVLESLKGIPSPPVPWLDITKATQPAYPVETIKKLS